MVQLGKGSAETYDISFMCSYLCNLECEFCMYDGGPHHSETLDLDEVARFIATVDLDQVNSFGLYGGEPEMALPGYSQICELLPPGKPRFTITNGSWSTDPWRTDRFLGWCIKHSLTCFVSRTVQHQGNQDHEVLRDLVARYPWMILKRPKDEFLPMGRLAGKPVNCRERCRWDPRPRRIAVRPDGKVIYQSCDAVYPVIGSQHEGFRPLARKIEDSLTGKRADVCTLSSTH